MRQATLAALGLLLFSPSLITAAPHDSQRHPYDAGTTSASHTHPPRPWRRLSDAIIRRIWALSEQQSRLGAPGESRARNAPGNKLVARYGEDVVLRFKIRTAEEAQALADATDSLFLDVWEFNQDWADIRIAKDVIPSLLGLLPHSLKKSHQPLMQHLDLAQAIFDSYPSPSGTQAHGDHHYSPHVQPSPRGGRGHPFFQDYQPLSVISPWMSLMSSMFTTHVRRISVGISYEGREIPALRIGVHPTNNDQPSGVRKTVVITGGSHAREWISTSTVNYLAWNLINAYGKDSEITRLIEEFDFVLVPTLNPDGYVYSWETDRLWRKNRQPTNLRFCHGIDLDRTYPYQWNGNTTRTNPCSESFAGSAPFDGIEALHFAQWATNQTQYNNVEFIAYLDLHSYSQQILYPYSYSCAHDPPSLEDLQELALGLAKAIRVSKRGHAYRVTSACEGNVALSREDDNDDDDSAANTKNKNKNKKEEKKKKKKKKKKFLPRIESSGGSALDWFYHELRVRYAYQIKLRDTGSYGFLLPRENIVPTGEEVLDAVLYLGRFMLGQVGVAAAGKGSGSRSANVTFEKMKEENASEADEVLEL